MDTSSVAFALNCFSGLPLKECGQMANIVDALSVSSGSSVVSRELLQEWRV